MALIKVDITNVVANVVRSLPRMTDTKRLQRELGSKAYEYWVSLAQTQLRSSSRDYIQGLSHRSTENREFIILVGQVPNMIEQGWAGGDMRDWMLKGPNAKRAKDGSMYNTVPFRHGTPGTTGRNVGTPMPAAIHRAAKKLTATQSRAGRLQTGGGATTLHGQRLQPNMRGISRQVKTMLGSKKKEWHTTSVWTGMQREEKTYESATQSQYTTFRRISSKSRDPRSWYHPGIKPRGFAGQVQERIEQIAPHLMRQILGG